MTLDARQEQELTGGGDTRLHYHLEDRVTNAQLAESMRVTSVSGDYTVRNGDDIIKATATCTITLPRIIAQREIQIIHYFTGGNVTVVPSGTDTIMGDNSMVMTQKYSSAHLKGLNGDWVLI